MALDKCHCVFPALLDLSADFHTIDHVFLQRLETEYAIIEVVTWMRSYHMNREQNVYLIHLIRTRARKL